MDQMSAVERWMRPNLARMPHASAIGVLDGSGLVASSALLTVMPSCCGIRKFEMYRGGLIFDQDRVQDGSATAETTPMSG